MGGRLVSVRLPAPIHAPGRSRFWTSPALKDVLPPVKRDPDASSSRQPGCGSSQPGRCGGGHRSREHRGRRAGPSWRRARAASVRTGQAGCAHWRRAGAGGLGSWRAPVQRDRDLVWARLSPRPGVVRLILTATRTGSGTSCLLPAGRCGRGIRHMGPGSPCPPDGPATSPRRAR